MSFVDWSPMYSVNHPSLDKQHQRLFKLISDLHSSMFQNKGREQTTAALRELAEYTRAHFAEEERQMELHGFPGLAAHKAAHEKLRQQLGEIEKRYLATSGNVTGDLFGFLLSDWLIKHIMEMDRQYAPYLKETGGKPG